MRSAWHIRLCLTSATLILAACSIPANEVAQPEQRRPELPQPAVEKPRTEVTTISLEDFFQLQQSGNAVIVDARPSFIYHLGHVPGAINLPKHQASGAITKRAGEFRNASAAGKKIVVYCTDQNCPDARAVAAHLCDSGIPATVFSGGWRAWSEADMPVE